MNSYSPLIYLIIFKEFFTLILLFLTIPNLQMFMHLIHFISLIFRVITQMQILKIKVYQYQYDLIISLFKLCLLILIVQLQIQFNLS